MKILDKQIQTLGIKKKHSKKELLFSAGEEARGFFYVLSGEIRVFRMDEKGREIEVVRLQPGDFFGEAAVFAAGRFPAFAETTKDSEVLYFERDAFFRKLEKSPGLSRFFLGLLARKCLILNERIEALGLRTVRQRLAQYLLSHCSGDKGCVVDLKIKKADLARLLGTASETLSRNLRDMKQDGLIDVRGRSIRVKNCQGLREELIC